MLTTKLAASQDIIDYLLQHDAMVSGNAEQSERNDSAWYCYGKDENGLRDILFNPIEELQDDSYFVRRERWHGTIPTPLGAYSVRINVSEPFFTYTVMCESHQFGGRRPFGGGELATFQLFDLEMLLDLEARDFSPLAAAMQQAEREDWLLYQCWYERCDNKKTEEEQNSLNNSD